MGLFGSRKTYEEEKEENRQLRARKEVRDDMRKMDDDRKATARENFGMRHEKKIAVARTIGGGISRFAQGISSGARDKPDVVRVVKVKKRKRKTKVVKVVRRKRKKSQAQAPRGSSGGFGGGFSPFG